MSFLAQGRLGLLLVLPVLVGLYLLVQRRRRRLVVRFSELSMLASVAPRRSGWRRHVPPALVLLLVGVLVVGFARPQQVTRVADRQAGTVMIAVDVSESMVATDVAPSRISAVKGAAREFIARLPQGLQVGLVAFDRNAVEVAAPTVDHAAVRQAVSGLQVGPGTAIGEAVFSCLQAVQPVDGTAPPAPPGHPRARIVLLSDGSSNAGRPPQSAALAARQAGVPVSTIAYGTPDGTVTIQGVQIPVPVDAVALRNLAVDSGGTPYTAATADQLRAAYRDFQGGVSTHRKASEVTSWLVGLALALVAVLAACLLLWQPALP